MEAILLAEVSVIWAPWEDCGLTWCTDVALFAGEVDMEAIALSGVTDWASWWEGERLLENMPLSGRSSRDFFDCFAGDGSDISMFRYIAVKGGDGFEGQSQL